MPARSSSSVPSLRVGVSLLTATLFAFAPTVANAEEAPQSTIQVVKKPAKTAPTPKPRRETPKAQQKSSKPARSTPTQATQRARALVERPAQAPRQPRALPTAPAPRPAVTAPAPEAGGTRVLPWITLAGSIAAGVAGAVFMSRAVSALNEDIDVNTLKTSGNTSTVELPPEVEAQQRRVLTNTVAGTALLTTALTGTIASIIALAWE